MSVTKFTKLKPGNPRPGIIFSLGFEYDWQIGGYDFLEYMERPEAFNPMYHLEDEFNPQNRYKGGDFLTYMSNEEKSDGLFDNEKDLLTQADKEKYRSLERISREEGCPKYFGVVSFDNQFLMEHGILTKLDNGHYNLDSQKLKELGRLGINKMISENSKFDPDNVYWNAAIHTNTDNVHIHYSICEYHRKEDRRITEKNNKQDCIDLKAFNALKSVIANRIIGNDHVKQLTALRDDIRKGVKTYGPKEQLLDLMTQLPENVLKSSKQKCGYNSGYVKRYRPLIDKITDTAIRTNPELYKMGKLFAEMTEKSQLLYKKTYGVGNQALYKNFRKNKMNELKERCGNEVLNAVREIYREQLMQPFNLSSMRRAHPSEEGPAYGMFPEQAEFDTSDDLRFSSMPEIHPAEDGQDPETLAEQTVHPSEEEPTYGVFAEQSEFDASDEPRFHYTEQPPDEYYDLIFSSAPENHPPEKVQDLETLAEQSEDKSRQAHPSDKETIFIKWTDEYKEALKYLYGDDSDPDNIIKRDPAAALKILLSECDKGNMLAAHDVGRIYASGLVEHPDGKFLGEQYYIKALNGFKEILAQNTQLLENFSNALNEKELKNKQWECIYLHYRIGKMYDRGLGTDKDYSAAKKHYEQAKDNKYAEFSLGNMYKYGNGVDINYRKAAEYFKLSAYKNMPFASYNLGFAYENGQGVEKNKDMASKRYSEALQGFEALYRNNKDDNICYRIGSMYLAGKGTEIDLDKAEKYLIKAADAKNLNAQYSLGKLYQTNEKKDMDKAEHFLSLAADQDDDQGLGHYGLGKLYLTEEKLDPDKAEEHFLLSAEKNNTYAQYSLGKLYLTAEKYSWIKAEEMLLAAAKQNNQYAQVKLGVEYCKRHDFERGREWLKKAAEQGNEFAAEYLAKPLRLPIGYLESKKQFAVYINPAFLRMLNEMQRHTQQLINEYEYDEYLQMLQNRSY